MGDNKKNWSPKRRRNILRGITLSWPMQSNWSGFFAMSDERHGKVQRETFLLRLFFGRLKTCPPVVRDLSTFPRKKSRLGLQIPISLQIVHTELVYFSFSGVIGICSPSLDFFLGNVLRSLTTGGQVFNLPKKRRSKKVSR